MTSRLDEIILKPAHWKMDDYIKAKAEIKSLMLEILEDCKHTMNTTDENSWVSWDEVSQLVKAL